MKYLYATNFAPTTSKTALEEFIRSRLELEPDDSRIECWALIRKDRDLSTLRFISFKVAVEESLYDKLIVPEMWPADAAVQQFVDLSPVARRPVANLSKN